MIWRYPYFWKHPILTLPHSLALWGFSSEDYMKLNHHLLVYGSLSLTSCLTSKLYRDGIVKFCNCWRVKLIELIIWYHLYLVSYVHICWLYFCQQFQTARQFSIRLSFKLRHPLLRLIGFLYTKYWRYVSLSSPPSLKKPKNLPECRVLFLFGKS